MEVDNKFGDRFFDETLIKENEKLPNKIKLCLEEGKKINLDDNYLNLLIHKCINIEKNIQDINNIKINIEKYGNYNNLKFDNNEESNKVLDLIKNLGAIEEEKKIILEKSSILNNDIQKQNTILNGLKSK